MWTDLGEGILEEFVEHARFTNEDTFMALSIHITKRREQHKKDCAAYRSRKALDPAWVAKDKARDRWAGRRGAK